MPLAIARRDKWGGQNFLLTPNYFPKVRKIALFWSIVFCFTIFFLTLPRNLEQTNENKANETRISIPWSGLTGRWYG